MRGVKRTRVRAHFLRALARACHLKPLRLRIGRNYAYSPAHARARADVELASRRSDNSRCFPCGPSVNISSTRIHPPFPSTSEVLCRVGGSVMYLDTRMLIESAFSRTSRTASRAGTLVLLPRQPLPPVELAPPRRPRCSWLRRSNVLCARNNRHLPCDSGRPDCYLQIYIICGQQ